MPKRAAVQDKQVLLLGSYGRGNVGDDAFLLAALQLFTGSKLYINAARADLLPQAVQGRVTTIATAGWRDLRHKLHTFRKIQHIVYCGGDLWVELYGDRFPRQALYKMVVLNLVARLFGKKVHYLGCGIGALQGYSLFLARLSARLANGIVVREPRSARVLGMSKAQVLPDLVTTLRIPATPKKASQKYTIGISILYHLPNPDKTFPALITTLAQALQGLSAADYRIVLFPMLASPEETHDDVWASQQLQRALPGMDVSIFSGREVDDYVAALADVDLLIGTRLHANIIALLAGVPVLGISYRPKVAQFFAMSGLADYCVDLADLAPGQLQEKIHAMQANRAAVTEHFLQARQTITAQKGGYQHFVAAYF